MQKVTNKEISEYVKKSLDTINGWKQRQPELLELCKLGMLCKKNNLSENDIKKLLELKESFTNGDK